MELMTLIPIALIMGLVELAKLLGLPSGWEKVTGFCLAIILGGVFYWNKDIGEIITTMLIFALSATGLYEYGVKSLKN